MSRPFMIGIGASNSGAGKTTVASCILNHFITEQKNLPLSAHKKWGAIKYTNTRDEISVIEDEWLLMEKNKDTWHLLQAGASQVIWVKAPRSGLAQILPGVLSRLSHLDFCVVEGNSAIEFLKPDVVIFIFGNNKVQWKPGIGRLSGSAHIVLYENRDDMPSTGTSKAFPRNFSETERKDFFETLSGLFMKKELKEEMLSKVSGGRISCAAAQKIAENLGISYKEVGNAANELGIKIKDCQLGCF